MNTEIDEKTISITAKAALLTCLYNNATNSTQGPIPIKKTMDMEAFLGLVNNGELSFSILNGRNMHVDLEPDTVIDLSAYRYANGKLRTQNAITQMNEEFPHAAQEIRDILEQKDTLPGNCLSSPSAQPAFEPSARGMY